VRTSAKEMGVLAIATATISGLLKEWRAVIHVASRFQKGAHAIPTLFTGVTEQTTLRGTLSSNLMPGHARGPCIFIFPTSNGLSSLISERLL
jgi:hypothetical protein